MRILKKTASAVTSGNELVSIYKKCITSSVESKYKTQENSFKIKNTIFFCKITSFEPD